MTAACLSACDLFNSAVTACWSRLFFSYLGAIDPQLLLKPQLLMGKIPPWADLHEELLSAIASCLRSNPFDLLCFRAVCKSWFSSSVSLSTALLSPFLPLRLPLTPYSLCRAYRDSSSPFSVLSATAVYALHPSAQSASKTWLLFVDELNPGKVSIRDLSTTWVMSTPFDFPRKLNLLDFRASEIARFYNLTHGRLSSGCEKLDRPYNWFQGFFKVVFLSNRSAVFALSEEGELGLLKLGVDQNVMGAEWEIIHVGKGFRLDDIVEYKGRLLGIDRRGRVYLYEMSHRRMDVFLSSKFKGGAGRRKRLIESSGILHLVVRCDVHGKAEEIGNIKVYELNENASKWIEVRSIGDQIFFFGIDFSFSTSVEKFEGFCGKNCILYEHRSFQKYNGGYGESWLSRGSVWTSPKVGVYHLEDGACLRAIVSHPCYLDLLWPTPTWIWLNNKSTLLGTLEVAIDTVIMEIYDENLKSKYKELASVVRLLVAGDGIGQQDTPNILEEIVMLKNFMSEIDLEIGKELKSIKKHIIREVASQQTLRVSTEQSDQIGASSHRSEGMHGCIDCHRGTTQDSSGDDELLSRKMECRVGAHIQLTEFLRGAIKLLELNTDLKDVMKVSNLESC